MIKMVVSKKDRVAGIDLGNSRIAVILKHKSRIDNKIFAVYRTNICVCLKCALTKYAYAIHVPYYIILI